MSLWQSIKRLVSNIFPHKDLETKLGIKSALSQEMLNHDELMRSMDKGEAPWNIGVDGVPSLRITTALNKKIAVLTTVEAEYEISGSERSEYLNEQLKPVFDDRQSTVQIGCAGGRYIYKPFVNGENINVTVVENNMYTPIEYNSMGELINAMFYRHLERNDYYYTLAEQMIYDENAQTLTYIYKAFQSKQKDSIGAEISLSSIEEWANLEELSGKPIPDVRFPWFAVFNMPQLNTIEQNAKQGMALCASAVDNIRKADQQEARTDWEFEGGELAIDAPIDLFMASENKPIKDSNGKTISVGRGQPVLPKGKNRLYRLHLGSVDDGEIMKTFSPVLRAAPLKERMNDIKQNIEDNIGISRGTISDVNIQPKTATEVEFGRQDTAVLVRSIQGTQEKTLRRLIDVMDDMADHYRLAPMSTTEPNISFWWKDSVLVTEAEEQAAFEKKLNQMIMLKQQLIIKPEELRAFYKQNADALSKLTPEMLAEALRELPQGEEE